MTRTRKFLVAVGVVAALSAGFFELNTHCLRGWLRGEAFYCGRPSSYWAAEIERWEPTDEMPWGIGCPGWKKYHCRPVLPAYLARWLPEPKPIWPTLFDGDPDGLAVLDELAEHPSEHVVDWAEEGIDRITSGDKGPHITVDIFGFPCSNEARRRHPVTMTFHGGVGPGY